jgi:hypothetical protein
MKQASILILTAILIASCDTTKSIQASSTGNPDSDTLITQSLFNDKNSTISEENIQKILDGSYKLTQQLKVAIVNLQNHSSRGYWTLNDEGFLKSQQSYMDLFAEKFKQSSRVTKLSIIPDLLISKSPSFTNIREAAIRLQADIVVVYSISSDIYSKYKLFTKPDIKAFATTQLIMLDVRTGLIPFSTIVTKDFLSQKTKDDLDNLEASNRIQNQAVLLTIDEISQKITGFLNEK